MIERNPNILVADGNEVNAMSLSRMMNLFHFNTDHAYTGKSVLSILHRVKYDIVLMNHWMPDMSGDEITVAIRKLRRDAQQIIIYILASTVTEEMKELYQEAGANRVFEAPLKMEQLLRDLRKYFPELSIYVPKTEDIKTRYSFHWNIIKAAFSEINEINIDTGIKSSLGNHELFIRILKSTYKEINAFISMLLRYAVLEDNSDLKLRLHNLKSVFSYIGAEHLLEETLRIEEELKAGYYILVRGKLEVYIQHLVSFMESMKKAVDNYSTMRELPDNELNTYVQKNMVEGYEQSIHKTIYYIRRYEYYMILQELDKLIRMKDENQPYFIKAAEEIKNFNYDKALEWLLRLVGEKS